MFKWLKLLTGSNREEETVRITAAGCTDTGRRRECNEDAFLLADLATPETAVEAPLNEHQVSPGGFLLAVADGLGGHNGGAIASRIAVKVLRDELARNHLEQNVEQRLLEAVQVANRRLREYAAHHVEVKGMGATLTAAYIRKNTAHLAHVGDTRAYLVRQGRMSRLTQDQTLGQYLLALGQKARATAHHVLMQAVGTDANVTPSLASIELQQGDCLLLCSDGLFNEVAEAEMAQVLEEVENVDTAAHWLIAQANRRGGADNITAVVARFGGQGLKPAHAPTAAERIMTVEIPIAV